MEEKKIEAGYFNIPMIYTKGDFVIFNDTLYIFEPNEKQSQFVAGIFPTDGHGWRVA